jgi:hypothetical protein
MASFTTALEEFTTNGDSRTSIQTATHTASKPKLVIQKRKVPNSSTGMLESTLSVVHATEDADGAVLSPKVLFQSVVRYPMNGTYSDVTAALAVFRDLVASDEFTEMCEKQTWM